MTDAAFWDRTAKKYAKTPIPNKHIYEQKLGITQSYFTPESKVLEIGCGTGTTALHHAPHVGHIDAWDISENMLDIARQKQQAQGLDNVSFCCAEVGKMSLPSNHYDVAMAHSILHLVDDKESTIAALYNTLKPGGVFISSTACLGNKMNWLKIIAKPLGVLNIWPSVYFFSSSQLENAIKTAGFDIEKSWLPKKAIAHFFVAKKPE